MALPPLLYLSAADVRQALPMAEAVAAARETFMATSGGEAAMPRRIHLETGAKGTFLLMACLAERAGRMSLKYISLMPDNRGRGLPLTQALVILADAGTGTPLAVMDGTALTAIRTGAASGAATQALARKDASVAAVFGAGLQARAQLEAVAAVRRLREARVFDPSGEAAEAFSREMEERLGFPVRRVATPSAALRDALIVCAATTSGLPVFEDADIAPGTHINAVGVFKPELAEIPSATVRRSRVIVDHFESALEEAGDLLRPLKEGLIDRDHFRTELGDVLSGRAPGRRDEDEITFFKSVGVAAQDLFAAALASVNARRRGIGLDLPR